MALMHNENSPTGGGNAGRLLHGSDIPKKFEGVAVKVKAIRKSPPQFRAPYIIDFDEPLPYGCKSWGVNATNADIIAARIGNDLEKIVGRRMFLRVVMQNNPQTDEVVPSLIVARIEGEKVVKVDVDAKRKPGKVAKIAEGIAEKDLPF